jgi:hypothetical protein
MLHISGFGVLAAVVMNVTIFWYIAPYGLTDYMAKFLNILIYM